MMSSSEETTTDSEYESPDMEDMEESEHSFENPNYRKLYAALSINSMMGENNDHNKQSSDNSQINDEQNNGSNDEELPMGWERHEDEMGPYFWHIPSGTIQRDPPFNEKPLAAKRDSLIFLDNLDSNEFEKKSENNEKTSEEERSVLTFLVNSLGWMEVEESQLTSATSSKLIQKCIIELSTRGDNNAVRCWGRQTQQLVLKIENSCLKLYEMSSNTLLNVQPIQLIRVWGVNDNNDFAFVAKDCNQINNQTVIESNNDLSQTSPLLSTPNGLKCHVFHCEDDNNSAQRIATYLRDEMIKLKEMLNQSSDTPSIPLSHNQRPKHLFIYDSTGSPSNIATPTAIEFPTPIEEPRKTIGAKYLGKIKVSKPMGIDVLNKAIETILFNDSTETDSENDSSVQRFNNQVLVHISPSNIIIEEKECSESLAECRVRSQSFYSSVYKFVYFWFCFYLLLLFFCRYLSFLGISSHNVKHCGFIMQIDDKQFEALCFECEPSSGALCKTIEAACKLRYQKCLDAHRQRLAANNTNVSQNSSRIKSTIINVFSKISNNIRKN